MSLLDRIISRTIEDLDLRSKQVTIGELEQRTALRNDHRPFSEALVKPGISVIAEHKRHSPSAGVIRAGSSVADVVCAYSRGGAAALSVLTEPHYFHGSFDDLQAARLACDLPILRKDFIVDPYQLHESAAFGADAVLLIVAALDGKQLLDLYQQARALDLDVLVEVHSESELETALDVDVDVIGINNRDLSDFSVDIQITHDLLLQIPAGKTVVSESGIKTHQQLADLERVGVDAVLVGEALMRSEDPELALRQLVASGEI